MQRESSSAVGRTTPWVSGDRRESRSSAIRVQGWIATEAGCKVKWLALDGRSHGEGQCAGCARDWGDRRSVARLDLTRRGDPAVDLVGELADALAELLCRESQLRVLLEEL